MLLQLAKMFRVRPDDVDAAIRSERRMRRHHPPEFVAGVRLLPARCWWAARYLSCSTSTAMATSRTSAIR